MIFPSLSKRCRSTILLSYLASAWKTERAEGWEQMRALLVHFYVRTGTHCKTIPVEPFMCKGSYEKRMRALLVHFYMRTVTHANDNGNPFMCKGRNEKQMRGLPVSIVLVIVFVRTTCTGNPLLCLDRFMCKDSRGVDYQYMLYMRTVSHVKRYR